MSTWKVEVIESVPTRTLDAWRICLVPSDGPDAPWKGHVWGFSRETCRGRVSSAIAIFDPVSQRLVSRSGRVYHLAGDSGANSDALSVWSAWKHRRGIAPGDELDVTEQVEAALTVCIQKR